MSVYNPSIQLFPKSQTDICVQTDKRYVVETKDKTRDAFLRFVYRTESLYR